MQLRNVVSPFASVFLVCALGCSAGASDQSDVTTTLKSTLQTRFPDVKIIDVRPAPMPNWYEVYTGDAIGYSDEKGQYLQHARAPYWKKMRNWARHYALKARRLCLPPMAGA